MKKSILFVLLFSVIAAVDTQAQTNPDFELVAANEEAAKNRKVA
jgi:hypothetical protein